MTKSREGWVTVEQAAAVLSTTAEELRLLSRRGRVPRIEGGLVPLVKLTQAYSVHLRAGVVTIDDVAARLGLSATMVRKIIADGFIDRVPGGVVLQDALLGYARWLRDEGRRSSRSGAESGLKAARQREIELRSAERESRLVDTEETIAFVGHIVGRLRAVFGGLPARYTRDVKERRRLEAEVTGGLQQVADLFAKDAHSLRTRGTIDDADSSADA